MTKFTSEMNDDVLHHLAEALTESGQAVSIYDSEDRLRYANETYRGIFLQGYEGPFCLQKYSGTELGAVLA
jgi:diguanylate cyclase